MKSNSLLRSHVVTLVLLVCAAVVFAQQPPSDWQQRYEEGNLMYTLIINASSEYVNPTVGNGYVATEAGKNNMYLAGVFNGNSSITPSHRAVIPSMNAATFFTDEVDFVGSAIDFQKAVFYIRWYDSANSVSIEQRWYAHRVYRSIMMMEIEVQATQSTNLRYSLNITAVGVPSSDIAFSAYSRGVPASAVALNGSINNVEVDWSERVVVGVVASEIPSTLNINGSLFSPSNNFTQTLYYITALRSTLDSSNPVGDAIKDFNAAAQNPATLLAQHEQAWLQLWQSNIEIAGDLPLALAVNSSLYYILSSIRDDWPWSLSPGGLSTDGYNGHTFWDAETWMYPPLLFMYPTLAYNVIQYRSNHLNGSCDKAASYDPPFDGAMFAWESAFTGEECCPHWAGTGLYEQHITGDVAYATRQYFYATQNLTWLQETGFPILEGAAQFWVSKVKFNNTLGLYTIDTVIPPDEIAGVVNNSVYTNWVASITLVAATEAADLLGIKVPSDWLNISTQIWLPFNEEYQVYWEFDTYRHNETIKQADVVMLQYPFALPMSDTIKANDLSFYSDRTETTGPAMTWGIYSICWIELGDMENAETNFIKSYANIQPPFNVWSENAYSGTPNFITGAGGFLQNVINGWGGLRLNSENMTFNPLLSQTMTSMALNGVWYLGTSFNIWWDDSNVIVQLNEQSNDDSTQLYLTSSSQNSVPLTQKSITFSSEPFTIHS